MSVVLVQGEKGLKSMIGKQQHLAKNNCSTNGHITTITVSNNTPACSSLAFLHCGLRHVHLLTIDAPHTNHMTNARVVHILMHISLGLAEGAYSHIACIYNAVYICKL